jgi:hypothetical protein
MLPGQDDESLLIWGGIGTKYYQKSTEWLYINFSKLPIFYIFRLK